MGKIEYCSFNDYVVKYDTASHLFNVNCSAQKNFAENIKIHSILYKGKSYEISDFAEYKFEHWSADDCLNMQIELFEIKDSEDTIKIKFECCADGARINISAKEEVSAKICGELSFGECSSEDIFAMCTEKGGHVIRSAFGPAASTRDNALFNRNNDSAIIFSGAKPRISFDYSKSKYVFCGKLSDKHLIIGFKERLYQDIHKIDYAPVNKNHTYKGLPPIGWMTWYSVKFDACEKIVLENARWMSENLKDYGANTVWVDWEWYHQDFTGNREDGVDTFNEDRNKYPNGLKYVSDEIKKMGLIPALWMGFTNDACHNEYTKENPDIILCDDPQWCGRYFYDFTNPKYINEFVPMAARKVFDWGYECVKLDTLPLSMTMNEKYWEKKFDPDMPTRESFRNLVKKVRETIGKDMYMMSCAGDSDYCVLWGVDYFDGARIGGDVFSWDEFIKQSIGYAARYYFFNNVIAYNDPDNLILRDEFNTFEQSQSRLAFVSLLGMPITFGDQFSDLKPEHIELLKCGLPAIDAHPMEANKLTLEDEVKLISLAVKRSFDEYYVLDVLNSKHEECDYTVSIKNDVYADDGTYLVFDYFKDKLICETDDTFDLHLKAYESRVLCIKKKSDAPILLSTSRHVTQGVVDIKELALNGNEISGTSDVIKNAAYKLTFYVPDGSVGASFTVDGKDVPVAVNGNLISAEFTPEKTGEVSWSFKALA